MLVIDDPPSPVLSRQHDMPFGAIPLATGGHTRFNLWAPQARSVHLCRPHNSPDTPPQPLCRQDEGWFSLETHAPAGTRYHYLIDETHAVPDPASRHQPHHVHADSQVVDPKAFPWQDGTWHGRPWAEAIIQELHVGTFSPEGTFDGVTRKLDYLADLGITALELMPLADFPGRFGWGYDGVSFFAPCARYGHPDTLKNMIQQAHARGMMVLLDVVYNHFGPEGNYLHLYAPLFFQRNRHTPWGQAINFDGRGSRWVRRFFIENALYWLEEFHFDGLRLDAVQAIIDHSPTHFLDELHETVASGPGKQRHVHLILENGDNATRFLQADPNAKYPGGRCQWNDDFHHGCHVLATSEQDGYYRDFHTDPLAHLGRCLQSGFSFQGEFSDYFGKKRGSPSQHLPPESFVTFLQNHDQTGNRPMGERLHSLATSDAMRAMAALLLLAPQPPMLFMGQEWGSIRPFYFFSDLQPQLHSSIVSGRSREFVHFFRLSKTDPLPAFPNPTKEKTFLDSKLDWAEAELPQHQEWLLLHKHLLALRKKNILPRLGQLLQHRTQAIRSLSGQLHVQWFFQNGEVLHLYAHLSPTPQSLDYPKGRLIFATSGLGTAPQAWFTGWFIEENYS
ncbi:MAG: treZ [Magnetococcales bacterium]|nr:treZ [Magnetococcales bacterium]HIJ82944.1 malto-oligosyltrehalose trehalohydrolase [Magnetococcales bacterium]